MIRFRAHSENVNDPQEYTFRVVSWTTFQHWKRYVQVAYAVMAIAATLGIYEYSNAAKSDLKDQINSFAKVSCLSGRATVEKYNDMVQGLIDTREDSLTADLADGNQSAIQVDRAAIARYKKDFLHVATPEECSRKILK